MKNIFVISVIVLISVCFAAFAVAAPAKLGFQNFSAAGQINYAATCSVVGVLDNSDKINDNNERINASSLRTVSLTKGGMGNYSTALNTRGNQFRISCVRTTDGTATTLKLYLDGLTSYWFPVSSGLYRFY